MDISIPNTNNLYRFLAISGLLLVIGNIYYPNEMIIESIIAKQELLRDLKIHTLKLKSMNKKHERFSKQLDDFTNQQVGSIQYLESFIDDIKSGKVNEKEYSEGVEQMNEQDYMLSANRRKIFNTRSQLLKTQLDLDIEKIRIETIDKKISIQDKKINTYTLMLQIGSIIGAVVSIYGFWNWIRIQNFYDKNYFNNQSSNKSE